MKTKSEWFKKATLVKENFACTSTTRCPLCEPDGNCDFCDTIDGRYMEAVNEYASTCDLCAELCHHEYHSMNMKTQLSYCPECVPEALKLKLISKKDVKIFK